MDAVTFWRANDIAPTAKKTPEKTHATLESAAVIGFKTRLDPQIDGAIHRIATKTKTPMTMDIHQGAVNKTSRSDSSFLRRRAMVMLSFVFFHCC